MPLVSTPTARVFSCPFHPGVEPPAGTAADRCPACARLLVPITMARAWRCAQHPLAREAAPGSCRRCGTALEERREHLPHGDHNPRHGGILFMAPDQWHHLEGAWASPQVFRLYFYDDFTRPILAASFRARLAPSEEGAWAAVDLSPAPGGGWLEARVPASAPPLSVTAWVLFPPREERFDFVFQAISVDPGGGPEAGPTSPPAASGGPPPAAPAPPASTEELAAEIVARDLRIRALLATGAWDRLYQPAMEAKDLALALEERTSEWEEGRRADLAKAARGVVRGAWLLDLAGDRGDGPRAREDYQVFAEGIAGLKRLFPFLAP
jgi:hypothetical protein